MKELQGSASAAVGASAQQCRALVSALERYPSWYPEVRRAKVIQTPTEEHDAVVSATVHLGVGPLRRDFDLLMQVSIQDDRVVTLSRVPHDPTDREQFSLVWRIEPGPTTRLSIDLRAALEVPRLLPLQGVGDSVARELLAAACRALEDS